MSDNISINIEDFLPKYPNIYKLSDNLFNMYERGTFEENIYRKKEFYDNKLEKVEDFPSAPGELFNHQKIIADFLSSHTLYDQLLLFLEMGCVDPNTLIPMWNGDFKRALNIKEGDLIIGDDGLPREVKYVVNGMAQMYQINQENDLPYIVNGEHILTLKIMGNFNIIWIKSINSWNLTWFDKFEYKVRTKIVNCNNISKEEGYRIIQEFKESIYTDDILEIRVNDYLHLPLVEKHLLRGYRCKMINWAFKEVSIDPYSYGYQNLKSISNEYLINDSITRLEVLAGIIDFNGSVIFENLNISFIEQLKYLADSLGLSCIYIDNQLKIYGQNIPTRILSSKNLYKIPDEHLTTIINIEPIGFSKYVGWGLDGNKRFLLNNFTVTHNTGKTCTSVAAIEKIRKENNGINGALIFARGQGLLNNYINEIVFKCTGGEYIPENYEKLTDLEKVHRINKSVKKFYQLETFETFAKSLVKMNNKDIVKNYSNKVIVIDEVHNLRIQENEKDNETIYEQFHRFLHLVKNCKIILMSGTPMKDTPDEISSVMNLILPLEEQLPTGETFIEEFFEQNNDKLELKSEKIEELKEIFKGRISYLKAMQTTVVKEFEGEHMGKLEHFKVIPDNMSEFQTKSYTLAFKKDTEEKKGIYNNSRQASLFVFPDGTYGSDGFKKYMVSTSKKTIEEKKKIFKFSLNTEFKNEFTNLNNQEKLEKLEKYSSKYAVTIRSILQSQEKRESVFVYCEYVQGSGVILFANILELFGFSAATGQEQTGNERPRYALITNATATQRELKNLINRFNKPDNINGKIINVIIGSKVIGEGFSLLNIQNEQILTPHWNYSETAQAIARGYRLGSHRGLIQSGIVPIVKIYQRVSIPSNSTKSIDLMMYEISENKDIHIKLVERVIKESAFDCALTYKRNHIEGYDNEADCDYQSCDYICDGIPMEMIERDLELNEIDYSTYNLELNVSKIINEITNIFRTKFKLNLNEIILLLPLYKEFEILTALQQMINENHQIINSYGFISYLKEENNIYFLVNTLFNYGLLSEFYTKYPQINSGITFDNSIEEIYNNYYPVLINKLCRTTKKIEIENILKQLPDDIKEFILEACILAKVNNNTTAEFLVDNVLEIYKQFYKNINNMWVSIFLKEKGIVRCLNENVWEDCEKDYEEIVVQEIIEEKKDKYESNPYGYYGQYSTQNDEFCIRDVSGEVEEKKHKVKSGKRCRNWKKEELVEMTIDKLKINPPSDFMTGSSKERLWIEAQDSKYAKEILGNKKKADVDADYLRRVLYWSKQKIIPICDQLQTWFKDNDLLDEDPNCGKQQGKKKI
jgi:superfamily II DNA or RNA helicase